MEEQKKQRAVPRILGAILRGELLLRMRADKFLPHILVSVVIIIFFVLAQVKIDQAKVAREKCRTELANARIVYNEKRCELAEISTVGSIEELLGKSGMAVCAPLRPATPLGDDAEDGRK